jgi:hypothetical protein
MASDAEKELQDKLEKSAPLVNAVAAHLTDMANAAEISLDSHVVLLALALLFAGHGKFTGLTEEQVKVIVGIYYNLSGRLFLPTGHTSAAN